MRIRLIAFTQVVGNIPGYVDHEDTPTAADDLAEQAGRLCYEAWGRNNPSTQTNAGYLDNIISQGHFSVLEHSSATFYFDGITRNCTHEFIRHRHLSYSELSQRYVPVGTMPFVNHPGLADIEETTNQKLLAAIEAGREAYEAIMDDLSGKGVERKQARQAARHSLPSGIETKILVSGNLRAWREVLQKRLSPTADLEFQFVAQALLSEFKRMAPNTFQDFN